MFAKKSNNTYKSDKQSAPSPASPSERPRRPRWRPGAEAGPTRDRGRAESAAATPGASAPAHGGSRGATRTARAVPMRAGAGARGRRPCGGGQPWARGGQRKRGFGLRELWGAREEKSAAGTR
jgi:hypothetical protein